MTTPPPESQSRPLTPTEALIASLWCEVLTIGEARLTDNFFAVGGHSLAAVRVVHGLRAQTGVELDLETFFDLDTLEQIAAEVDRRHDLTRSQDAPQTYEGEL